MSMDLIQGFVWGTIGVIVILIALQLLDYIVLDCKHKYGKWEHHETPYAYVSTRYCEKCGASEVTQYRKMAG